MPTMILAMHMANELLSLPVAVVTVGLAAGAVGLAARRSGKKLRVELVPLMGVMGAFVFAAQMINFTLPFMPGTSGHLGGAVLLAILLGPAPAIVTMTGILIIQCLLFQDGGLLALGCNVINMGVVPAILGWWIFRQVAGAGRPGKSRLYLGAWLACTIGVAGGAALVPIQAGISGVLRIPFVDFLLVMLGVHLLIGMVEGAISFAVLAYLWKVQPALLEGSAIKTNIPANARLSSGVVIASMAVTSLLLAGVVSLFASSHPDGLEWSCQEHRYCGLAEGQALENPSSAVVALDQFQQRYAPMPDYSRRAAPLGEAVNDEKSPQQTQEPESAESIDGWVSLAGLAGTAASLGIVYVVGLALKRKEKATK